MNEDTQNINVETLSDKVKAVRTQARDILRMKMINNRFAKIFDFNTTATEYSKEIEAVNKKLAITVYNQNKKLDEEHPDFENIKTNVETTIKSETEYTEKLVKEYNDSIAKCKEEVTKLEAEITEIENGDKKVNIEDVNALSTEILAKI